MMMMFRLIKMMEAGCHDVIKANCLVNIRAFNFTIWSGSVVLRSHPRTILPKLGLLTGARTPQPLWEFLNKNNWKTGVVVQSLFKRKGSWEQRWALESHNLSPSMKLGLGNGAPVLEEEECKWLLSGQWLQSVVTVKRERRGVGGCGGWGGGEWYVI